MPKITLGITELPEILGRYYGIEKPQWEPSFLKGKIAQKKTDKENVN